MTPGVSQPTSQPVLTGEEEPLVQMTGRWMLLGVYDAQCGPTGSEAVLADCVCEEGEEGGGER